MNLYLVTRIKECDYDEYDSFVCTAKTEKEARNMHPRDGTEIKWWKEWTSGDCNCSSWVKYTDRNDPNVLKVELLGQAEPDLKNIYRIVCSSFNAG